MPGSYTYLTKAQMRQALAARLDDPAMVYWVSAELDLYNAEALRTWQSETRYWRDTFSFNTRPLSAPVNAFYDLTQVSNTLIPFTLKDTDLESQMCYNLIEKQPSAGVWQGTDQFTIYDLTQALQRRRDQFLVETGMVLTRQLVSGIIPPIGSVALDDSVIDLRHSAWLDALSGQWSTMWKSDEYREQALNFNWYTSPGIPTGASMTVQPPVRLQLLPPPLNPGELETLTVNAGAALDPTVGVLLGIPDDFTWVIKFGALADLLGQDGQARDPARAAYCESRWQEGIIAARAYTSVELAFINGSQVPVSSLFDLDTMQPGWQNSVGAQQIFALAGWNMLAISSPLNTNVVLNSLFEDNFQRPNEDPLSDGGKWATVPGTDTLRAFNNVCQESGFLILNYGTALYTGVLPQDQFGQFTLGTVDDSAGTGLSFDIFVRSDSGNVNLYGFDIETTSAQVPATVYKANGASIQTLATLDPSVVAVPGDTWTLAAVGAGPVTLYLFRNGTLVQTVVDNGPPILGGSAGPAMTGDEISTAHGTLTDWQCGGASVTSSITVDVVRNAPVPIADGDFVQLGREELDAVLDYAAHLACFKMGGAEFQATMRGLANFRRLALVRNERLAAAVRSAAQPLWDKGWREERQRLRREIELPQGISLDEVATRGGGG